MRIWCLEEKRLLIARKMILLKKKDIQVGIQDILDIWANLFPKDFQRTEDGSLGFRQYEDDIQGICDWILEYTGNHSLKDVDIDIKILRRKQHSTLKKIYKPLKYGVILKQGELETRNKITQYLLLAKGFKMGGNYDKLLNYAKTAANRNKDKKR